MPVSVILPICTGKFLQICPYAFACFCGILLTNCKSIDCGGLAYGNHLGILLPVQRWKDLDPCQPMDAGGSGNRGRGPDRPRRGGIRRTLRALCPVPVRPRLCRCRQRPPGPRPVPHRGRPYGLPGGGRRLAACGGRHGGTAPPHRQVVPRQALFPLWTLHGLLPVPDTPDPLPGPAQRLRPLRHRPPLPCYHRRRETRRKPGDQAAG